MTATRKFLSKALLASGLVLATSCGVDDDDAIAVSQPNDLGIASLRTAHLQENGNSVFELRAFSADQQERASLRLIRGPHVEFNGDIGTEILISVSDSPTRITTREVDNELFIDGNDVPTRKFLQLDAVASALKQHVNVHVPPRPTANVRREVAQEVYTCQPANINVTPLGKTCCESDDYYYGTPFQTRFINPSNQVVEKRLGSYGPCKASNGASCSGTSCASGPNGYKTPVRYSGSGYPFITYHSNEIEWGWWDEVCDHFFSPTQYSPIFGNVTGTFPNGRGCCINGSGPCGPGLIACTSCGGGGAAGQGYWDP
jgi:hypothetical protein